MNRLAQQLDEKLRMLDPQRARDLESRVRDALRQADQAEMETTDGGRSCWPVGYFAETAGKLAGEEFQRPEQGELPQRDAW